MPGIKKDKCYKPRIKKHYDLEIYRGTRGLSRIRQTQQRWLFTAYLVMPKPYWTKNSYSYLKKTLLIHHTVKTDRSNYKNAYFYDFIWHMTYITYELKTKKIVFFQDHTLKCQGQAVIKKIAVQISCPRLIKFKRTISTSKT